MDPLRHRKFSAAIFCHACRWLGSQAFSFLLPHQYDWSSIDASKWHTTHELARSQPSHRQDGPANDHLLGQPPEAGLSEVDAWCSSCQGLGYPTLQLYDKILRHCLLALSTRARDPRAGRCSAARSADIRRHLHLRRHTAGRAVPRQPGPICLSLAQPGCCTSDKRHGARCREMAVLGQALRREAMTCWEEVRWDGLQDLPTFAYA